MACILSVCAFTGKMVNNMETESAETTQARSGLEGIGQGGPRMLFDQEERMRKDSGNVIGVVLEPDVVPYFNENFVAALLQTKEMLKATDPVDAVAAAHYAQGVQVTDGIREVPGANGQVFKVGLVQLMSTKLAEAACKVYKKVRPGVAVV